MNVNTYVTLDATDLSELIRKKEVSPLEITQLCFQQLENVNSRLNAVVRTRKEEALAEGEAFSRADGPFAGIPILLKDISQAVKGSVLTSGSGLLKDYEAANDSRLVETMRTSGMIAAGHTNTPEFGLKNITEPLLHGPARNPWNSDYSPGGSSGGAAAAVASGIVPVAGASDGGGSIRIPASFTGLFGLKPTRGRMPVGPGAGRQWQGAAIDFVLSRSVRDSAAMFDLLQTVQPEAAFQTPKLQSPALGEMTAEWDRPMTIAISTRSPVGTPVSDEAVEAVKRTAAWLEGEGFKVEDVTPDIDGEALMRNYYLMNSGEMAGVVKTLGKLLGRPLTADDMEIESWVLSEAGKKVRAADFSLSLQEWDTAAAIMEQFHKKYDFYITPATANTAPEVGELTHTVEAQERLRAGIAEGSAEAQQKLIYDMFLPSLTYTPYTQLANLTGQPAMSVPVHMSTDGMPLGVQVMASKGREDLLFRLAFQLERSSLWHGMKGNPYF